MLKSFIFLLLVTLLVNCETLFNLHDTKSKTRLAKLAVDILNKTTNITRVPVNDEQKRKMYRFKNTVLLITYYLKS